jgi:formylglycine-generating enzyme required for sulfatase activity
MSEEESGLFTELPKSFHNPHEYDAEYILIHGGQYRYSGTKELKTVQGMYFAKYPVTNKRYRRFIRYLEEKERGLLEILPKGDFDKQLTKFACGITGFTEHLGNKPNDWPEKLRSKYDSDKRFNGENQPVVFISWFCARAYCCWLSLLEAAAENLSYDKVAGLYKLPSEIEWEWAASGGKREYPWVPEKGPPSDKLARYGGENMVATTPVGRYPDGATPEGLMDMVGNVWEWMENWDEEYKRARCLRGGSWDHSEDVLRCSYRCWIGPADRVSSVGFRVVRSQS